MLNALISKHSKLYSYAIKLLYLVGPTVLINSLAILENATLSVLLGEELTEAL